MSAPRPHSFATVLLLCAVLIPSLVFAQFTREDPKSVGLAIFPFSVEYPEDRDLANRMESSLRANLARRIGHPVYTAEDVLPALSDGVQGCLADRFCIPFMGDQFNVSLVAHPSMVKVGEELNISVDFYATGNGLRIADKSVTLRVGDDAALLRSFTEWVGELFDASLLVSAESLAGEGGVIRGEADEEEQLAKDLKDTRRNEKSYRRQDFEPTREAEVSFDRNDPTAGLRAVAAGEERSERRDSTRSRKKRKERAEPSYEGDFDLDSMDEQPKARSKTRRKSKNKKRSALSLDARQTRGSSVASYSEAQRAGLGAREYKRFTRSGLTFSDFQERRWAHGGRFHIRVGGYYGFGWLTRRYSTFIYVAAGDQKTEEWAWESLGFNAVNPGVSFGLGYAPLDFLQVELELSVMLARQDLRDEYRWPGSDGPVTNKGREPRSSPTGHFAADLRARFFVNPKGRLKFSPGLGMTLVAMGGYTIEPLGPLEYSSRPNAVLVGLTPVVGMTAALSPFLSLYVDLLPTFLLSRGAALYDELIYFNGETERNGLEDGDLNPPLRECGLGNDEGLSSCPLFFRVGVGTMIMF